MGSVGVRKWIVDSEYVLVFNDFTLVFYTFKLHFLNCYIRNSDLHSNAHGLPDSSGIADGLEGNNSEWLEQMTNKKQMMPAPKKNYNF
jgi:hypothetical protein